MATWALWWLILGLLAGWVGLWVCDKLFLRDGQVAGLRAEREASAALAALEDSRGRLQRTEHQVEVLQHDLAAHNDQADILRTELDVMRNERGSIETDLAAVKEKLRMQQQEIESARKLAVERVEEIERLEKEVIEVQAECDKARGWAQGREAEAADLTSENGALNRELQQANRLLASANHQIERAQRQTRALLARSAAGRPVNPRELQRMTGRMRKLSSLRNTIDALAAADQARRRAGTDRSEAES